MKLQKNVLFTHYSVLIIAGVSYYSYSNNLTITEIPDETSNKTLATEAPNEKKFMENTTTNIKWKDNEEIQIIREYLQIPSVHPNIDYGEIGDQ